MEEGGRDHLGELFERAVAMQVVLGHQRREIAIVVRHAQALTQRTHDLRAARLVRNVFRPFSAEYLPLDRFACDQGRIEEFESWADSRKKSEVRIFVEYAVAVTVKVFPATSFTVFRLPLPSMV